MPRKPKPSEPIATKPVGDRADYIRLTITLSPEAFNLVVDEAKRLRLDKRPDANNSAVIRDAVMGWYGPGGPGTKRAK